MVPDIEVPNTAGSFPHRRQVLKWASGGVAAATAGLKAATTAAQPRANIGTVAEARAKALHQPLNKRTVGFMLAHEQFAYKGHQRAFRKRRDHREIHAGQPDQKNVIDFYGGDVLPKLGQRG